MKYFAIVVPCYNEASNFKKFIQEIQKTLEPLTKKYQYDIYFINDGSSDSSESVLKELGNTFKNVYYTSFSRNFGKEVALYAGLQKVQEYDFCIIMDADLQHPVSAIPEMIQKWEEGYEDVFGEKQKTRGYSFIRFVITKIYYLLIKYFISFLHQSGGDFRLLDKKVVKALSSCMESERYTKGLYNYVGFRKASVTYTHEERYSGTSKWGFKKLFILAFSGIFSFSLVPLRISMIVGFSLSLFSAGYIAIIIFQTLYDGIKVPGYASLMTIFLFFQGVLMIMIGILGEYVGRTFMETKKRPLYFVRDEKVKVK